ncbi:hypothetical protein QCA50_003068 [Cerrena zonata]|uniref:C2H2-type domain-containing protein n=2 Tax=Cerrena zonata TaxID=2478898 RepID=A0AAW0GR28_9APHY
MPSTTNEPSFSMSSFVGNNHGPPSLVSERDLDISDRLIQSAELEKENIPPFDSAWLDDHVDGIQPLDQTGLGTNWAFTNWRSAEPAISEFNGWPSIQNEPRNMGHTSTLSTPAESSNSLQVPSPASVLLSFPELPQTIQSGIITSSNTESSPAGITSGNLQQPALPATGYRHVICPFCYAAVQVGIKNDFHLRKHTNSVACSRARDKHLMLESQQDVSQCAEIARRELISRERTHAALFPLSQTQTIPVEIVETGGLVGGSLIESTLGEPCQMESVGDDSVCHGYPVVWETNKLLIGSVPWQAFEQQTLELGCTLVRADIGTRKLWLQSMSCQKVVDCEDGKQSCRSCYAVVNSGVIHRLMSRSSLPWDPHTSYDWLTPNQLREALEKKNEDLARLRTKTSNNIRKVARMTIKIDDNTRLISAIATSDGPRITRVVHTALKQNVSIREILNRVVRATEGTYHVKGYTKQDVDLARIFKILGHSAGAYVASHALGLPSISTTRQRSNPPVILPSASSKTMSSDIPLNLRAFFPSPPPLHHSKRGHNIEIDNIAVKQGVQWIRGTNTMVGPCREHCSTYDLSLNEFDVALKLAHAMHGDNAAVHYASEATVVAIAPYDSDNYHPLPICVSGSCKAECGNELAILLTQVINDWHSCCEDEYGPLWTVDTDGGTALRGGCYKVLMVRKFQTSSEIYRKLSPLKGLNLECGVYDIVMGPDGKHVLKRIATHSRSPEGSFINGVAMNRQLLTRWLRRLPILAEADIEKLLDPADHQNVPNAVKLLRAIILLGSINTAGMTALDISTHHAFCLQAELWNTLLDVHINPKLSLPEQLTLLSKHAHLLFALYRLHGSSFLSNQLYSDIQAMVKAAFVCVAQQQILDPSQPFYLYQIASDRLEEMFAEVRTQTHDSNCDISQLAQRLSTAGDLVQLYDEYPEWSRGHRRLKYAEGEGIDHVSPTFFKGDMVVERVHLNNVWNSGCVAAQQCLKKFNVKFDINTALDEQGVDFLLPNGGGKYPGVSAEPDRSIPVEEAEANVPELDTVQTLDSLAGDPFGFSPNNLIVGFDKNGQLKTADESNEDWLEVPSEDGRRSKPVHKSSIMSYLFCSKLPKLCVDRLLRVRGYTRDFRKPTSTSSCTPGEGTIVIGDTAIAPFRSGDLVALGVMKVTTLTYKNARVEEVSLDKLEDKESDVVVTGQMLCMEQIVPVSESDLGTDSDNPEIEPSIPSPSQPEWVWTGKFVQLQRPANSPQLGTRTSLLVRAPGHLVHALNMPPIAASILPKNIQESLLAQALPASLSVSQDCFQQLLSMLFAGEDTPLLPNVLDKHGCTEKNAFPYRSQTRQPCFILENASRSIATKLASGSEGKYQCHQCHASIEIDRMRSHVGQHILCRLLGVPENSLHEQIQHCQPCGFCGRDTCTIDLKKSRNAFKVISSCPYASEFKLGNAKKSSKRQPCTNVPIHCSICDIDPKTKCRPVFWKFNIFHHIQTVHPAHWSNSSQRTQNLPSSFVDVLSVSDFELQEIVPLRSRPYPVPATTTLLSQCEPVHNDNPHARKRIRVS